MAQQEVLAERLARLETGARGAGAVGEDARVLKGVDDAGGERALGPDDHEVGADAARERDHRGGIGGVDGEALRLERHAAVAGGDADGRHARAAQAGLEQGVLAAAGAEDEDVQRGAGHGGRLHGAGPEEKRNARGGRKRADPDGSGSA